MATLVLTSATTLQGTAWTGTAPGPGAPTVSGTISSSKNWTDHLRQVQINMAKAMQDFTTFGDGAFVSQKPGLTSCDVTLDFNQDFAASDVDAVFGAALIAGTLLYFDFTPTSAARGTTNPSYVVACYVDQYTPIGQTVGDRAAAPVGLAITGSFARLTS